MYRRGKDPLIGCTSGSYGATSAPNEEVGRSLAIMVQELARRSLEEPHPSRLGPDTPGRVAILTAHADAMAAGEPGYLDPATGLFVFTAAHHAERGTCCEQDCRHCPYVA